MLEVNETAQMFELVNRNHYEAEKKKAARNAERHAERSEVRHALRLNWTMKAMRCAAIACVGIGCGAAAIGGLYPVLTIPMAIGCGMYAAGIFGALTQERRGGGK